MQLCSHPLPQDSSLDSDKVGDASFESATSEWVERTERCVPVGTSTQLEGIKEGAAGRCHSPRVGGISKSVTAAAMGLAVAAGAIGSESRLFTADLPSELPLPGDAVEQPNILGLESDAATAPLMICTSRAEEEDADRRAETPSSISITPSTPLSRRSSAALPEMLQAGGLPWLVADCMQADEIDPKEAANLRRSSQEISSEQIRRKGPAAADAAAAAPTGAVMGTRMDFLQSSEEMKQPAGTETDQVAANLHFEPGIEMWRSSQRSAPCNVDTLASGAAVAYGEFRGQLLQPGSSGALEVTPSPATGVQPVFQLQPSAPSIVSGSNRPMIWGPRKPQAGVFPSGRLMAAAALQLRAACRFGQDEEQAIAAEAVAVLAANNELRKGFWDTGCGSELLALLKAATSPSRQGASRRLEAATAAVTILSCAAQVRGLLLDAGAVPLLAELVSQPRQDTCIAAKANACRALANMACHPRATNEIAAQHNLVAVLVAEAMPGEGRPVSIASEAAFTTLANLTFAPESCGTVIGAGGVSAAAAVLQRHQQVPAGSKEQLTLAALLLLWNAASMPEGLDAILDIKEVVVPALVAKISPGGGTGQMDPVDPAVRQAAVGTVGKLSLREEGAAAAAEAGGISALSALLIFEASVLKGSSSRTGGCGVPVDDPGPRPRSEPAEVALREGTKALVAMATDERRAAALVTVGAVAPLCVLLSHRGAAAESRDAAARGLWLLLVSSRWEAAAQALQLGVLGPLMEMLADAGDPRGQISSAKAVANLSVEPAAQAAIGEAGAIALLIAMLQPGESPDGAAAAAAALSNLCCHHLNCSQVASLGGIPLLVMLMQNGDLQARASATRAVVNLAGSSDDRRAIIAKCGAIEALMSVLWDASLPSQGSLDSAGLLEASCSALANLMRTEQMRRRVADAGAVAPLAALARDASPAVSRAAATALQWLATLPDQLGKIQSLLRAENLPATPSGVLVPGRRPDSSRTAKTPAKVSQPPVMRTSPGQANSWRRKKYANAGVL